MSIWDIFRDAAHNRNLYKTGQANRDEIRLTTVGWRPDPINKQDGFTPDPGNDCVTGVDPTGHETHDTPSGNKEYYRVIRQGRTVE